MVDVQDKETEIMITPEGKCFSVFRGDAVRKTDSKVTGTLYDIEK